MVCLRSIPCILGDTICPRKSQKQVQGQKEATRSFSIPSARLPLDGSVVYGVIESQTSRFVSTFLQMRNWLSMRFRDAPLGAIGLLLIVLGVMLFPLAASFAGTAPSSLRKVLSVLSVLFLLFPPAILSAVYSLFFEKSKFYGVLNVLLVSIVVLLQPLAWHWLGLYLPIACVFTIFCAVVWVLKSRSKL